MRISAVRVITFSLSLGPTRAAKTQWRLRLRSWNARGTVQGPAGSTALPTPGPYMKNKATELRWINGPWLGRRLRSVALWFPRWPAI